MSNKIRVGIVFGGKSAEHEVSLQSAKNFLAAIDRTKFEPVPIGISKDGHWLLMDETNFLLDGGDPKNVRLNLMQGADMALVPASRGQLVGFDGDLNEAPIDVVFPILHGPFGEDGTVQGLLKLAGIPFVGADVLGSAVGMDKDVMKRLLRDAGIAVGKFIVARNGAAPAYADVVRELGLPLFVKPANLGSSVGISKVRDESEYRTAMELAYRHDRKVIIEENIVGREIECAVLGNDNPQASLPGEVVLDADFYSYDVKYVDEHGASVRIPADLPPEKVAEIQTLAVRVFQALECRGLGRVDFFLKPSGEVVVNEINTIPGFTNVSMYPKLWEATGISYTDLITNLIELAMEEFGGER